MTSDLTLIAQRIDAQVRLIPGVEELYFAAALPARLWQAAVHRTGAYASVTRTDDVLEATVSIGVTHGRADEVARQVAECVREVVGEPGSRVTVRISRVAAG